MTAETLTAEEAAPEAWPAPDWRDDAGDLSSDLIGAAWQRLEDWTAARFAPREVVWQVAGPGAWRPPLGPVVEIAAEAWSDGWQAAELEAGPDGYNLGPRRYRITATVGAGPVPPAVREAFDRLVDYWTAEETRIPGANRTTETVDGASQGFDRPATWQARALIYSGAADLLRRYRRT